MPPKLTQICHIHAKVYKSAWESKLPPKLAQIGQIRPHRHKCAWEDGIATQIGTNVPNPPKSVQVCSGGSNCHPNSHKFAKFAQVCKCAWEVQIVTQIGTNVPNSATRSQMCLERPNCHPNCHKFAKYAQMWTTVLGRAKLPPKLAQMCKIRPRGHKCAWENQIATQFATNTPKCHKCI